MNFVSLLRYVVLILSLVSCIQLSQTHATAWDAKEGPESIYIPTPVDCHLQLITTNWLVWVKHDSKNKEETGTRNNTKYDGDRTTIYLQHRLGTYPVVTAEIPGVQSVVGVSNRGSILLKGGSEVRLLQDQSEWASSSATNGYYEDLRRNCIFEVLSTVAPSEFVRRVSKEGNLTFKLRVNKKGNREVIRDIEVKCVPNYYDPIWSKIKSGGFLPSAVWIVDLWPIVECDKNGFTIWSGTEWMVFKWDTGVLTVLVTNTNVSPIGVPVSEVTNSMPRKSSILAKDSAERVEDMMIDIGDGVKMEFVWVKGLRGWVGKYEVTNQQYRRFKQNHDSGEESIMYKAKNMSVTLNDNHQPVVMVSYTDVVLFVEWVNRNALSFIPSNYEIRVPDVYEWMTFAQCGDERRYYWGDDMPPKYGNYRDESSKRIFGWWPIDGYDDGFPVSCPVEESGRNDWGLYGVGGNVWEWTNGDRITNWCVCGASWNEADVFLRWDTFRRQNDMPSPKTVGFRLVLLPKRKPTGTVLNGAKSR